MPSRHEEDIMRIWLTAAAAAASIGLAACGSSGSPASGSASHARSSSDYARIEADVRCLRAHGVPDFPDPVYDPSDGWWHYADFRPAIPSSAQQACQHLDPSAVNPSPPVPQAQFQALVRLAQCIRQHGVPTWPDPTPQGQFRLPPQLLTKSPAQGNAIKACQRYIPSGGMDVGAAS
jgi:hypothetical protein